MITIEAFGRTFNLGPEVCIPKSGITIDSKHGTVEIRGKFDGGKYRIYADIYDEHDICDSQDTKTRWGTLYLIYNYSGLVPYMREPDDRFAFLWVSDCTHCGFVYPNPRKLASCQRLSSSSICAGSAEANGYDDECCDYFPIGRM